jgi:hypothetical protein
MVNIYWITDNARQQVEIINDPVSTMQQLLHH